jgi:hypothetical protein
MYNATWINGNIYCIWQASRQVAECWARSKEGLKWISSTKAQDFWDVTLCCWLCSF